MLNQQTIGKEGEGVIARQVRQVYSCLSLNQLGMREISCSIKVAVKPIKTTTLTIETTRKTRTKHSTLVAELRSNYLWFGSNLDFGCRIDPHKALNSQKYLNLTLNLTEEVAIPHHIKNVVSPCHTHYEFFC